MERGHVDLAAIDATAVPAALRPMLRRARTAAKPHRERLQSGIRSIWVEGQTNATRNAMQLSALSSRFVVSVCEIDAIYNQLGSSP